MTREFVGEILPPVFTGSFLDFIFGADIYPRRQVARLPYYMCYASFGGGGSSGSDGDADVDEFGKTYNGGHLRTPRIKGFPSTTRLLDVSFERTLDALEIALRGDRVSLLGGRLTMADVALLGFLSSHRHMQLGPTNAAIERRAPSVARWAVLMERRLAELRLKDEAKWAQSSWLPSGTTTAVGVEESTEVAAPTRREGVSSWATLPRFTERSGKLPLDKDYEAVGFELTAERLGPLLREATAAYMPLMAQNERAFERSKSWSQSRFNEAALRARDEGAMFDGILRVSESSGGIGGGSGQSGYNFKHVIKTFHVKHWRAVKEKWGLLSEELKREVLCVVDSGQGWDSSADTFRNLLES